MNLFSKEKEIIFKITNAVLLIWFVAALVLLCTNTISLLVKDPSQNYTYEEYKSMYCGKDVYADDISSTDIEESCKSSYNNSKLSNESSDYYKLLYVYGAAANIIIVGGALFFLNNLMKQTIFVCFILF